MTAGFAAAVMAGIASLAVTVKALAFLAARARSAAKFADALQRVPDIAGLAEGQGKIIATVERIESTSPTTTDIEKIVTSFHAAVDHLTKSSAESDVRMAVATFKAHTVHCPTASYIIATTLDGNGTFMWANPVWYDLIGLDEPEAMSGQWWNSIDPRDAIRVRAASDAAAARRAEFSVRYRLVNLRTGGTCRVHAQAWPLVVNGMAPDEPVLYLGAIKVIDDEGGPDGE